MAKDNGNKFFGFYLNDDLSKRFKKVANELNISLSLYVRDAVEKEIIKNEEELKSTNKEKSND